MSYLIQDLGTGTVQTVSLVRLLEIVNDTDNPEWIDYTAEDWQEGWREWAEGDIYTLLGITNCHCLQASDCSGEGDCDCLHCPMCGSSDLRFANPPSVGDEAMFCNNCQWDEKI
jgi:hypothetical protein